MPPAHLESAVRQSKSGFDKLNISILNRILEPLKLRVGCRGRRWWIFLQFQDYVNAKYQTSGERLILAHMKKDCRELGCCSMVWWNVRRSERMWGYEEGKHRAGIRTGDMKPSRPLPDWQFGHPGPAGKGRLLYRIQLISECWVRIALAAVGVTLPLLPILWFRWKIFLRQAQRFWQADSWEQAIRRRQTGQSHRWLGYLYSLGLSMRCRHPFMEPLLRAFGASEAVLPQAGDYAFWMFVAAPCQSSGPEYELRGQGGIICKISSIAVVAGAALNVVLDPVFMFDWDWQWEWRGFLATTVSQFVTFLSWLVLSVRTFHHKNKEEYFKPGGLSSSPSRSSVYLQPLYRSALLRQHPYQYMAAKSMTDADLIIAAYGVVQRLVLIGCYVVMGFMQDISRFASLWRQQGGTVS